MIITGIGEKRGGGGSTLRWKMEGEGGMAKPKRGLPPSGIRG